MTRSVSPRLPRDESRFPTAPHELTDAEVREHYGCFIRHAVEQMARDVDTFVDMAESANQIIRKREQAEARKHQEPTSCN